MRNSKGNPFENYFHIEKAEVDKGLLKFEEKVSHVLAKAFFDYYHAIDMSHGRAIEVVDVGKEKCVTLPKSTRNRAKVIYAGFDPVFAVLDKHYNLITYMVIGSVIRVEYLGLLGKEKKVKYFKCL